MAAEEKQMAKAGEETPALEVLEIEDAQTVTAAKAPDATSTNAREWPRAKKWRAVALAALYTFISPVSSSMVAPALPYIAADLQFTTVLEMEMALSVFVLAYAVGPLVLAPLSEVYGRYRVMQASMWVFVAFNTACGLAQTRQQLLLFRFVAGLGGSGPVTVAGSIVSDCFDAAEMGAAIAWYSLGVILAPALGPVLGGFATQGASWHWVFYAVSAIAAALALAGTALLPETYRPFLEQAARRRAQGSRLGLGNRLGNRGKSTLENVITQENTLEISPEISPQLEPRDEPSLLQVLGPAFMRPFVMLATQPIVQAIALLMAFVYGVMYIVLTTFSALFVAKYAESTSISTLNYLALGIGFLMGNRLAGVLVDMSSVYLQKRNGTGHRPEYRLPICIPASLLLPIGLFIYGWSAEYAVHWIVPNIGIMIFAMSVNITFQTLSVYTVDVYVRYSASALAAVGFLRSLAGFGFPLFSASMYDKLGYGWGNSILAFVGIFIGIPAPILLYVYGERLRAKSKFGSG